MTAALPVAGLLMIAAALGAATSLFDGRMVLLMLAALAPLPLIFRDYRVGVLLLTLVLPIAPMLPPVRGLNVLNFLTLATLLSFALRAGFSTERVRWLPGRIWWGLVIPVTVALIVAWPHIPEGARNYPRLENARHLYDPLVYAVDRYAKPLLYFLSYAFLLANAVRASRRPEWFIGALAASVVLPSLAVLYTVATYPGSFAQLAQDREFMAPRGMHANEFGMLLALASGPLLFVAGGAGRPALRRVALAAFMLVTVALVLTFSRGGLVAYLVGVTAFLLHHRRLKTIVAGLAAVVLFLLAAPDALQDRLGAGIRAGALRDASDVRKDELTAGRLHGWNLLAPEVLENPWLGGGRGSTQWSAAVAAGRYKANHPHNIYLELLMDLGLLGTVAVVCGVVGHLRRFRQLAREPALGEEMRSFFLGARFALWGGLVMAATTAYYMPNPAQAYLWFALGLAFADWPRADRDSVPVSTPHRP